MSMWHRLNNVSAYACVLSDTFYLQEDILKERKIDQRLPRVGGNVKSYMLAYDFNITAYAR